MAHYYNFLNLYINKIIHVFFSDLTFGLSFGCLDSYGYNSFICMVTWIPLNGIWLLMHIWADASTIINILTYATWCSAWGQLVHTVYAHLQLFTSVVVELSPNSSTTPGITHLVTFIHMAGHKYVSLGFKNCINLASYKTEHHTIYSSYFKVSTSVKYPLKSFAHFHTEWFFFLFLVCNGFKYILNSNPLSGACVPSMIWLSFHSLNNVFLF